MDGRMSPTEGARVVEKPFTLLLRLFPGQDHTRCRYDDCMTTWGRVIVSVWDWIRSDAGHLFSAAKYGVMPYRRYTEQRTIVQRSIQCQLFITQILTKLLSSSKVLVLEDPLRGPI